MAIERITRVNPPDLHPTGGYHHITMTPPDGRFVFLAGQCPLDRQETVVGKDDIDAQIDQVVSNALVALSAAGAEPQDVVRSVLYVVSGDSQVLAHAWHRFAEETALAPAFTSASTLLGVTALGYAEQLIELDLTVLLSA